MRKAKTKKAFLLILSILIIFISYLVYYLINDPNGYGDRTAGFYTINPYTSEAKDIQSIRDLTLTLDKNGTYEFSKKLPFLDQNGNWLLDENGLVVNILLLNQNGTKDKISICCDDNNEITLYCYLDKSQEFKRIIFIRSSKQR
ncbi:hypothetical protein [Flavobacterium sp. LC2016-01]|uniref:hypothetical protein n=1 Tax=Flavobacterium sp. LC2016-01 TaxID=2675876 RepID=UPI0012BAA852|nr:hypothetical protein [Flavobacterium sp. LC2016-01]MTH15345.1 hypothetical protein [Flavobacterium sp. LC2016-01]